VIRSPASVDKQSSFGVPEIKLFMFYKVEDPEYMFGEGKCHLTYYVLFHLILSSFLFSLSLFTIWFWAVMISFNTSA
jgi:hypothetical protein